MSDALAQQLDALAALVAASQRLVAFTGAGISTESGIPDFRSPGGIWARYRVVTYQEFLASDAARKEYWQRQRELYPVLAAAQPNAAHLALAELERLGKLECVITQNVDGLHQRAGNATERVIELHGTGLQARCLSCERRYPSSAIYKRLVEGIEAPTCEACGGWLKPATISFGQAMPVWELGEAERRSARCDLFLVVGSTLVVYPAAALPALALGSGARLAIVNLTETPYDAQADLVVRERAGQVLSGVLERVRTLR